MLGWIALDIDGTITPDKNSVPEPVCKYLKILSEKGWKLVFATGRPLAYAKKALAKFSFPYFLIAQNGSVAFEMPGDHFLFKNYLNPSCLEIVEEAHRGILGDFLIYAGFERGDICFYRKNRFPMDVEVYLKELQTRQKEKWQSVHQFDPDEIGFFPLIKCFGTRDDMNLLANRLEAKNSFEIAQIRDPQFENIEILLITAKGVNKGAGLKQLLQIKNEEGQYVIAAGDDANDRSLLLAAHKKIAMPHAPKELLSIADTIAPPLEKMGIIQAIEDAIGS